MKQPCIQLVRDWFLRNHDKEATATDVHKGIQEKFSYVMVGKSCNDLYLSGELELVRTEKINNDTKTLQTRTLRKHSII